MEEEAVHACDQPHMNHKQEEWPLEGGKFGYDKVASNILCINAESCCIEFEIEILSHNEHPVSFQYFGYETLLCNI